MLDTTFTDTDVQAVVLDCISAGDVRGVWSGLDCSSWTLCRRGARKGTSARGFPRELRSSTHLHGLPGLNEKEQKKVSDGNVMAQFTMQVVRTCMSKNLRGEPVGQLGMVVG
jgi:hypothetical protein